MEHLKIPQGYHSPLTIRETEVAIKEIKDCIIGIDRKDIALYLITEGQEHYKKYGFKVGDIIKFSPSQVNEIVKDIPIVDAVPVIKCKDCGYYMEWHDGQYICARLGNWYGNTKPDDFCSKAEEREDVKRGEYI